MTTVKDVLARAAEEGIVFSEKELDHIASSQRAERARLIEHTPLTDNTFADKWTRFYPRLLSFIVSLGETVLTFSQTVIVALGVPFVLVLLLIVEHQRVVHGITLFEADMALANFAALALVVLNLVLEFTAHYVEHKEGYKANRDRLWSLRIWWKNMLYRLGYGDNWQEIEQSPAQRYKNLLKIVTFSILALALVGSMKPIIEQTPGAWYEGIGYILSESSLLLMLTWVGGLLFAFAAVLSAQGLSRYVAVRCVEILSQQKAQNIDDPHSAAVEEFGVIVANGILKQRQDKKIKPKIEAITPHPAPKEYIPEPSETPRIPITQVQVYEQLPEVSELPPNPFGQNPPDSVAVDLKSMTMPKPVSVNGNGNGNGSKKE